MSDNPRASGDHLESVPKLSMAGLEPANQTFNILAAGKSGSAGQATPMESFGPTVSLDRPML
jgi:hypothetical protein